jgi:hypothetical protein
MAISALLILCSLLAPRTVHAEPPAKPTATPEEQILRALEQRVELNCREVELHDFIDFIKLLASLEITVDPKTYDDPGVQQVITINCHCKGVKLRTALDVALADFDLRWFVWDGTICIGPSERADVRLQTRVCDVADLVARKGQDGRVSNDFGPLIDTILRTIRPSSWSRQGAYGAVAAMEAPGVTALVIHQRREVVEDIHQLLSKLRRLRPPGDILAPPASRPAAQSPRLPSAMICRKETGLTKGLRQAEMKGRILPEPAILPEERLRLALERPVDRDFVETPLEDVIAYLKDFTDAHVEPDRIALDDEGIGLDCSMTFLHKGIKLRSALTLMLERQGLTWLVKDEVLLITTPDRAGRMPLTEVYGVSDLVAAVDAQGRAFNDFDALIRTITRTIAPKTWDSTGGRAAIVPFEAPGIAAIVVAHRREAHEAIGQLLGDLRRLRRPGADTSLPIKNRVPKTQRSQPAVPLNWILKGGSS